jgi:hypothetical protein
MRRWLTAIVLGGACAAWPIASAARGTRSETWGGARHPTLLSLRLEPVLVSGGWLAAARIPPSPSLRVANPRYARDLWSFAPMLRDRRGPPTSASRPPLGPIFDAIVRPRADALALADDVAPLPATADWRQACQLSFALAP